MVVNARGHGSRWLIPRRSPPSLHFENFHAERQHLYVEEVPTADKNGTPQISLQRCGSPNSFCDAGENDEAAGLEILHEEVQR